MESKRIMCQHCGSWFFPEEGVTLDDCPKCGRTVEVKPAPAPLPEEVEGAVARLKVSVKNVVMGGWKQAMPDLDTILRRHSDLTRRVAEAEQAAEEARSRDTEAIFKLDEEVGALKSRLAEAERGLSDANSCAAYNNEKADEWCARCGDAENRAEAAELRAAILKQENEGLSSLCAQHEASVRELEAANLEKDVQRCEANMHAEDVEARVPESDDVAEALAEISAAGLKGVAVGLRLHIKGLTRRLAEAEAKKEQVIRWHDDLAKKCRNLLDDAVKYTQHRHQLEARVLELEAIVYRTGPEVSDETHCGIDEERCPTPGLKCHYCQKNIDKDNRAADLEAFKARVMEWASERCICGLVGKACPKGMFDGETKWATSGPCPNWTPPQAWEVGE